MTLLATHTGFQAKPSTIIIEAPVPPTHPFLVTSVDRLLWVNKSSSTGRIRVAYRKDGVSEDDLFREVILEVLKVSLDRKWQNVFPRSRKGMDAALARMLEFEYSADECDVITGAPLRLKEPSIQVSWIPRQISIVVPSDRSYLGWIEKSPAGTSALIHNPSRAICFLVKHAELDRAVSGDIDPERFVEGLLDDPGSK